MSEPNLPQKDSPKNSSFSSINWISLWQASGNTWSWVDKGYVSNPRSCLKTKEAVNQRKIIFIEILLTIALLLLARYIESSRQLMFNPYQKTTFFESTILNIEPNSEDDSF